MIKVLLPFASPTHCLRFANRCIPWGLAITALLLCAGLFWGFIFAPPDYQQGDGFRIIYLHVPAAVCSLGIYALMASFAIAALTWRIKLAHTFISALAPLGAWITLLALVTGALWGKPMWGTYWIWDARLTSELILLFLYLGIIALQSAMPPTQSRHKAVAWLVLIGFIDIPIIHFSVNWWHTLHQGASLSLLHKPTIATPMLIPLLLMLGGMLSYVFTVMLLRARNSILEEGQAS
ncbi:MAG: heme ABC transporter permease [marine bacterium B5-7]|nr:MAG: heme ABC transporter permease [marine bacterium B5-7]